LQQVNRLQTQERQIKEKVLLPLLSSLKFIPYEIKKKNYKLSFILYVYQIFPLCV